MLLLAVILNPRAKKRARLAGNMNGNVHSCDGDGDGNHGNAMETTVQQDEDKGPTMP